MRLLDLGVPMQILTRKGHVRKMLFLPVGDGTYVTTKSIMGISEYPTAWHVLRDVAGSIVVTQIHKGTPEERKLLEFFGLDFSSVSQQR